MIKIITIFSLAILLISCENSKNKSQPKKREISGSSEQKTPTVNSNSTKGDISSEYLGAYPKKDSISYSLGVNQAEMMLNKSNLDTRDFDQKELIKGFKENLYTSPILDSICKLNMELFLGENGQSLNSDFAASGSYCIGKLYAHNFLTIWSKSEGINRLNLKMVVHGFEDIIKKNIIAITSERRKDLIKVFYENLVNDVSKVMIDALNERSNVEEIIVEDRKNGIIDSAIIYIESIKKGTGPFPTDSSNVSIDYILTSPFMDTLENTYKSYSNQKPPFVNIKSFYPGMRIAIPKMQKNGIYQVFLPFEMVEDERLPFPYICFYIELLDFKETSTND
ncbi:MAG: hypothetical protein P8I93_02780 [Crocinitomicaceae bacterium]|nr:hypothetical protein [Crocinitomicaceae bacterium]